MIGYFIKVRPIVNNALKNCLCISFHISHVIYILNILCYVKINLRIQNCITGIIVIINLSSKVIINKRLCISIKQVFINSKTYFKIAKMNKIMFK